MLFKELKVIFHDVWAAVDPDIFYDLYRPLLSGSWAKPLRLRCEADCPPILARAKGPSAGQSTLFVLVDVALGVRKESDVKLGINEESFSSHATFQSEMLAYMPPAHRALVLSFADAMADAGSLATYLEKDSQPDSSLFSKLVPSRLLAKRELSNKLTGALAAYTELRRFHLSVALRYLRRTATGTGGSSYVTMLQDAHKRTTDATQVAKIQTTELGLNAKEI